MPVFLDIYQRSLNKFGEEMCGDQVKILKTPTATIIVLSDGLGSGIKANILATMTTEMIMTMLREQAELKDVIDTVIRTLPVDRERRIAYATFTILTIDHSNEDAFTVINFDNPPPLFFRNNTIHPLETEQSKISGKKITISRGHIQLGDFLGLISDGILYAGLGTTMNFGWGWENIARYIEDEVINNKVYAAHTIVNAVVGMTYRLYHYQAGDDATFVGVYARERKSLMVFSGPPLDNGHDWEYVNRFLEFDGRKALCGGTTANIVAEYLGTKVKTIISSITDEVPAIGELPGVNLVTEGVLTLAVTLELLKNSDGKLDKLQSSKDGAHLLAHEMLSADAIFFLVGQSINPYYQNPLLPKNISIRRFLIDQIVEVLKSFHKDVIVEYC